MLKPTGLQRSPGGKASSLPVLMEECPAKIEAAMIDPVPKALMPTRTQVSRDLDVQRHKAFFSIAYTSQALMAQ